MSDQKFQFQQFYKCCDKCNSVATLRWQNFFLYFGQHCSIGTKRWMMLWTFGLIYSNFVISNLLCHLSWSNNHFNGNFYITCRTRYSLDSLCCLRYVTKTSQIFPRLFADLYVFYVKSRKNSISMLFDALKVLFLLNKKRNLQFNNRDINLSNPNLSNM